MSEAPYPRTPNLRLDDRRALVTGAGRSLGLAAAAALAQAGASVVLCARTAAPIETAAAALRADGHQAEAHAADVADIEAFGRWIAETEPFDIFVNNAGTNRPRPFLDATAADFDVIMDLNVRAAFFAAQAVARRLKAVGRHGSIINVSSQLGHVGAADRSIYSGSKHALEGITKSMAIELGAAGIRVNAICPTFVDTPLTASYLADPDFRAWVVSMIPLGRLGRLEDVMGAVVFLASDAAALMTGSSLMLDGGWTAR